MGEKIDRLKTVENFVLKSFKKVNMDKRVKYFNRTLHWTGVLKPDASEALKIAALTYDIQDAFRQVSPFSSNHIKSTDSIDYHQKEGAKIIKRFLEESDFPDSIREKVYDIVAEHETGNGKEHVILRDADRINYFENVAIRRARASGMIPPERIKEEFQRMLNDIKTEQARQLAEPFYKKALGELTKK